MAHTLNTARWQAISAVPLDVEDAAFPFSARLARDNGWSEIFARRVIEEYRRFCYLAVTSGREVTPSDEVDQAWHLHLTYSRHYWGTWTEALGAPLHHGPTAGGGQERSRYRDNYEATLARYEEAFGETPPSDIWPSVHDRFRNPGAFRRLDTSKHLILPKRPALSIGAAGAALGAGVLVFGASGLPADVNTAALIPERFVPFAIFGAAFAIIVLIAILTTGGKGKGTGSGGCGAGYVGHDSDGGGGDGGCSGCGGCGG